MTKHIINDEIKNIRRWLNKNIVFHTTRKHIEYPILKINNLSLINYVYWLIVLKFHYKLENKLFPSYFEEFISKK